MYILDFYGYSPRPYQRRFLPEEACELAGSIKGVLKPGIIILYEQPSEANKN